MWVGLSREPTRKIIQQALARHAPGARVWWGDLADPTFDAEIALSIDPNPSEFPFVINGWVVGGQESHQYELGLRLAEELCVMLDCSTICNGSHHGPTKSPYWSIIWQRGVPFLADDCGTLFADYSDGLSLEERRQLRPVKILHPIQIDPWPFDFSAPSPSTAAAPSPRASAAARGAAPRA